MLLSVMEGGTDRQVRFARFFEASEPRLRRALCAVYGADAGSDAAEDALAWCWQHWERVESMQNPVGYLYRVGQTAAARSRWHPTVRLVADEPATSWIPETEPAVREELAGMSESQRVAVVLVHGFGYRHREVAEILGCSPSTVANHVERGMAKLRARLGVSEGA